MNNALTFHTCFSPEQFNAGYNLRAGRPDHEITVIPDWLKRSTAAREMLTVNLNIRYGDGERQTLD